MAFLKHISSQTPDSELVSQYRETGGLPVLGELYQRYMELVYGVCLKYLEDPEDAKDAVLNIFEELVTKLQRHEVENFKSWLYTLAKNHCLMKLRSTNGKILKEITHDTIADAETDRHELLENEKTYTLLEEAMEELNAEQRQCVTLFYLQKKSYSQISEETGFSPMQVKSYIQNGKRNLKIGLERKIKEQDAHKK